MSRTYSAVLPLLVLWLAVSIFLSWGAVQDDALIHLRYADNLFLHHFITYDGVHGDYGASSLLYVALLALLRGVTASPNLPRAVSSVAHGILFAGLAYGFVIRLPRQARVARFAGLALLILLVTPSAVRWLDDGMETGIAVSLVSLLAWLIHGRYVLAEEGAEDISPGRYLAMAGLAFLAVMLRTELVLVCGAGWQILAHGHWDSANRGAASGKLPGWRNLLRDSHLLLGGGLAVGLLFCTMHVFLPDTAVAKAHGLDHWFNPIHDTAVTLSGALSFGLGMLGFWLLTFLLVALRGERLKKATVLANAFFPMLLAVASLRGQEIQGVRYFAWTFFFSSIWNILELARLPETSPATGWRRSRSALPLGVFLMLLAAEAPFEVRAMHRVLSRRAETMRSFESQHLDALHEGRGVASDVGYIGYFTKAEICDLAGLVNGRDAARLSSAERAHACIRIYPDFVFLNVSQLIPLMRMTDLSRWKICGRYEFTNVRSPDTHYLLVRPEMAAIACRAAAQTPEPIESILQR